MTDLRFSTRRGALMLASLVFVASPLASHAQSPEFAGELSLGIRSVDLSGSRPKFRQDLNLSNGLRLFRLGFTLLPGERLGDLADRVDLDLRNLGGDPYSTVGFGIRKYGRYQLRFDRRGSDYFYDDTILPLAQSDLIRSTGGDFHRFNFERVRDLAELSVQLTPAATVRLGWERFSKTGGSMTTLDVERDEFKLDQPIDENSNAYSAGFSYAWERVTIMLEERIEDYDNATELFLPSPSAGLDTEDPATLTSFTFDQFSGYRSLQHVARLKARPTPGLDLGLAAIRADLDLDMRRREIAEGTTFQGAPFTTDLSGPAELARDIELYDLEGSYRIGDHWSIQSGVQRRKMDEDGNVFFDGESGDSRWTVETTRFEAVLGVFVTPRWNIAAGWNRERRETLAAHGEPHAAHGEPDAAHGEPDSDADRLETVGNGLSLRTVYTPSSRLRITGSLQENNVDDPFTLVSPTDGRRIRVQGRYAWENGLVLGASYLRSTLENEPSGWKAESAQSDVSLAYATDPVQLSLGYTRVDRERSITQTVTGGSRSDVFPIDFESETGFIRGSARFSPMERIAVGGSLRLYDNTGSFPTSRNDLRGFVEIGLASGYALDISYRVIDFNEDRFDDYRAEILEVAVGYR